MAQPEAKQPQYEALVEVHWDGRLLLGLHIIGLCRKVMFLLPVPYLHCSIVWCCRARGSRYSTAGRQAATGVRGIGGGGTGVDAACQAC